MTYIQCDATQFCKHGVAIAVDNDNVAPTNLRLSLCPVDWCLTGLYHYNSSTSVTGHLAECKVQPA